MEYRFRDIEKEWQKRWKETNVYKVSNESDKPKCYVLDMFPYPSGTGLHVGHPLGYIGSDIYSRYKRLKGFNVLHPMGFDSFGLPAEQYALDTGQHPVETTRKNIETFKSQLNNVGFCFDWSREVQTSDPKFYKWTQWIFLQLFKSFYNRVSNRAESIDNLVKAFEKEGNRVHPFPDSEYSLPDGSHSSGIGIFTATEWKSFDEKLQHDILMQYRLAYCGFGEVNWCEALGTVLANDEVINGVSERGGYPVVKKKLRQWYLRITEYAERLLKGLEKVEFSEAMKEMQTNWIGKSSGAEIDFQIESGSAKIENKNEKTGGNDSPLSLRRGVGGEVLKVYTTRPDTIYGVDFMVIAPEHELVEKITTEEQRKDVEEYIAHVKSRSERERMAEKKITGVFTGSYALNPFDGRAIPIWISEYVLAGYGTGAIMGVPCGDERDHKFARHFKIHITNIIGSHYNGEEANPTKEAVLENSGFLDGLVMKGAIDVVIKAVEERGVGRRKTNYKMRDAAFSRQRYWGEPFPIKWKDGTAYSLNESELPLELPHVETYKPGPDGEGPLTNIPEWVERELETNTMPGYAGSSWYFLRYMDPHNDNEFCERKIADYWNQVDLYVGGTEHAVGHLLYSRMWTKFLFDIDLISYDEPYKKLLNQGMIQGSSRFVYRLDMAGITISDRPVFISNTYFQNYINNKLSLLDLISLLDEPEKSYCLGLLDEGIIPKLTPIHVDVNIVDGHILDIDSFKKWKPEYSNAIFVKEPSLKDLDVNNAGDYLCGHEVEKMSKSKFNTVNPDDLVVKYGADTFRMYEMFLGPIEMSKPWDTKGIEGVHRFIKKFWRLFVDETKGFIVTDEEATAAELKVLHQAIKKIESDTERFSFNTAVSAFMIATNELTDLKCHKRAVLEALLVLLAPYAPHVSEELWNQLGNKYSVLDVTYPVFEESYIKESTKEYPVAINGKTRSQLILPLDISQKEVEAIVLNDTTVQKWLEGKKPKKIIYVKNKMINVVV